MLATRVLHTQARRHSRQAESASGRQWPLCEHTTAASWTAPRQRRPSPLRTAHHRRPSGGGRQSL
eukprot:2953947-Prymnesium_polylepis.1